MKEQKWYSLDRIMKYDVKYRLIIGERSNGKTYAVKKYVIDNYKSTGKMFMYVRRTHQEIVRKYIREVFQDIQDYAMEVLGSPIYFKQDIGFFIRDEDENEIPIGYYTSLEDGMPQKGVAYPEITTIFFDEFMAYGELDGEIPKFLNMISTIRRKRDDVEVFMLGNTVWRGSVYFNLFGIDIKKLEKGHIYFGKHKAGATFAIERTTSMNIIDGVKQTDEYLGFDNSPTSSMILYGEWEYDVVNTGNIDGISWNAKRLIIPIYVTALQDVYELSLYLDDENPVAFVRRVNTQDGKVNENIKINLTYDNSVRLVSKKGIIPSYGRINALLDKKYQEMFKTFKLCIDAKRIVFDKISTGSDFMKIIGGL